MTPAFSFEGYIRAGEGESCVRSTTAEDIVHEVFSI